MFFPKKLQKKLWANQDAMEVLVMFWRVRYEDEALEFHWSVGSSASSLALVDVVGSKPLVVDEYVALSLVDNIVICQNLALVPVLSSLLLPQFGCYCC